MSRLIAAAVITTALLFAIYLPVISAQGDCPGAPPSYLAVGNTAWVMAGQQPNNVRSEAGAGYGVVTKVYASQPFSIIDGPVCADGYRWWMIRDQSGSQGWTADGTGGQRWLEGSSAPGGAVPTPAPVPTTAPLPTTAPEPAAAPQGTLRVVNESSTNICEVLVFGPGFAGPTNILPAPSQPIWPGGTSPDMTVWGGTYDVELRDCASTYLTDFNDAYIPAEQGKVTVITFRQAMLPSAPEAVPGYFSVNNQSSTAVCGVYATLSGMAERSQVNLLGGQILNPGMNSGALEVEAGRYWDIEVRDCNQTVIRQFEAQYVEADTAAVLVVVGEELLIEDEDSDGFSDEDELWLAQTFNPYYIFDENESVNLYNDALMLYQVSPTPELPACTVLITYIAHFPIDGGDEMDAGFGVHAGDNEAVRICAVHDTERQVWWAYSVVIHRHYDAPAGYVRDGEYFFSGITHGMSWDTIHFRDGEHIILYVSKDKHAAYTTEHECESYHVVPKGLPDVWDFEDCSGWDFGYFSIRPELNVGERDDPNFNWGSESDNSFLQTRWPDQCFWCAQKFCADVASNSCAGETGGKWWPTYDYSTGTLNVAQNNQINYQSQCGSQYQDVLPKFCPG
jgi:hypothetical protein